MALVVNFRLFDYRQKRIHEAENVEFEQKDVDGNTLLEAVSHKLGTSSNEIDIFFGGRRINPSTDFLLCNGTGFESGCDLQVMYKPKHEATTLQQVNVDVGELKMCMAGLHLMLNNRHQKWKSRKAVLKILKDQDNLQEIIDSIPSLKNDATAIDILKSPDLFASVVDPKNCENVNELHNSLAAAIIQISHKVSTKSSSTSPGNQAEGAMDTENTPSTSRSARRNNRPSPLTNTPQRQGIITSSQLAQALSLANSPAPGRIFPSPMGTPSSAGSMQSSQTATPSTGSGSGATPSHGGASRAAPDVFSLAMQQALAQASSGSPDNPSSGDNQPSTQLPENVIQDGLEQLRSMGIHDEEASRQALMAAGGNVQAAVNILFASGMDDL